MDMDNHELKTMCVHLYSSVFICVHLCASVVYKGFLVVSLLKSGSGFFRRDLEVPAGNIIKES